MTPIAALAASGPQARAQAAVLDPVVALYARWHAAWTACHDAGERHAALRAAFVRRHGEIMGTNLSVWTAWGADPRHAELQWLRSESDRWNNEATDILDILAETPAVSAEGAVCKVRVLAATWAYIESPDGKHDFHEEMTLAFVRDAVRVLDGGRVA
jgi:hypothetical protein